MVAIVLALLLGHFFGAGGIAAGIAFGAWSNAFSLIRQGAASFGFSLDADARRRLPRIVAAALVMGGLLWLASGVTADDIHGLAQAAILLRSDRGRDRDLRPAAAGLSRHHLADEVVNAFSEAGIATCTARPCVANAARNIATAGTDDGIR